MQQTETYKLNKPGIDDPLAIAPLNENADTLERELTRVDTEKAALDARVTVLEADKVRLILGSYVGSGKNDKETQNVQLGTTPKAVFFPNGGRSPYMIVPGTPIFDSYCGRRFPGRPRQTLGLQHQWYHLSFSRAGMSSKRPPGVPGGLF